MNRNILYLVIAVLVAGIAVVGYMYYEESQSGVSIEIGKDGAKIEGN
jgi:predicted negative regulator of RcsB-dependent stress response